MAAYENEGRFKLESATHRTYDSIQLILFDAISKIKNTKSKRKLSLNDLEKIIGEIAVRRDIENSQIACIMRYMPLMLHEYESCKKNSNEAIIRKAPSPKFRIWTNGKDMVADSISEYVNSKNTYAFWIDLDTKKHGLRPKAIEIFQCLIRHIGQRIPIEKFIEEVYGDTSKINTIYDSKIIGQYLSDLEKHCNGQFRKHLFSDWINKGLGLDISFKNNYFLFERLRH